MADFAEYISTLAKNNIGGSANIKLSDGTKLDGVKITGATTNGGAIIVDDNMYINNERISYIVLHKKQK